MKSAIQLRRGDARKILPTLPDESFDVLATDPPWGVPMMSTLSTNMAADVLRNDYINNGWGWHLGDRDEAECLELVTWTLTEALRLLPETGHAYLLLGHRLYAASVGIAERMGWKTRPFVWTKPNPPPGFPGLPWRNGLEPALIAYRKLDMKRRYAGGGTNNYWHGTSPRGTQRVHPTQKPVALFEHLIGGTPGRVLDPFCGAGASMLAARRLGQGGLGIDTDAEFIRQARRRLATDAARMYT